MTFTVDSQLASRVVVIHIMLTHTVSNRAFVVVRSLWATSAKILEVEWEINRRIRPLVRQKRRNLPRHAHDGHENC